MTAPVYHVGACPACNGSGQGASITVHLCCEVCKGFGIVRLATKDIPIVRRNTDGEWEQVDDAVTQLGNVAPG